jgi:hypothetical protein
MHRATRRFWRCYLVLPPEIQSAADQSFALLKHDPAGFLWVWIGTHAEYDRLIKRQP